MCRLNYCEYEPSGNGLECKLPCFTDSSEWGKQMVSFIQGERAASTALKNAGDPPCSNCTVAAESRHSRQAYEHLLSFACCT
ncbi:hypothetical protein SKAU_G00180760 [Synaphobranchus kaupii]|uniref:Uncharacterized protein n=1 Tax=Synaphobranchus kaupii TaxID=118154 RepID=A0A9Q1FMD1_SYNKA|nr:hypothetical protein SKAU_G00180760 [Synaphobranchus kaupii]